MSSPPGHAGSPKPSLFALGSSFFAIYIVWGASFIALRYSVETIPPFLLMALRFLIAGAIMAVFAQWTRRIRPTPRQWRNLALTGVILFAGCHGPLATAQQYVPSGIAALVMASIPLLMPLVLWAYDRQQAPSMRSLTGILVGFAGVAGLIASRQGMPAISAVMGAGVDPASAAMMLSGALAWAVGTIMTRYIDLPRSIVFNSAWQLVFGGLALLALAGIKGEVATFDAAAVPWYAWAGLAYMIVAGSLWAFSAYVWLIGVISPTRVATYAFINPVIAVILGWAIAGEPVTTATVAAMAVIVAAVAVVVTKR